MNILNDLAEWTGPQVQISQTTNGPPLWAEILRQLPGGIIAGGAVRDWLLGVEPKDIDVFFGSRVLNDFVIPHLFEGIGGEKRDANSERAQEYAALPEVELVLRGVVSGFQIDLVFLNVEIQHPRDLLERFDFGITRSAFHPDYGLIDTPEARLDRINRTVTLLLDDRPERAQARFDRFNDRMSGLWRFVK